MAEGGRQSQELSNAVEDGREITFELFCAPCDEEGRHVEAFGFCNDCSEYLCKECYTVHHKAKPSRHHVLLDQLNMPNKPASSRKAGPQDRCTDNCHKHTEMAIEYYCHGHDTLACSTCAFSDHRTCDNVDHIPNVSSDIHKKTEFTDMISRLKNMESKGSRIKKNLQESITFSEENANAVLISVKTSTQEIISTLQKHENDLEFELKQVQSNDKKRLEAVTASSQALLVEVRGILRGLTTLQQNRQYCNLFVALKKARNNAQTMEQDLDMAYRVSVVDELQFEPDKELRDTLRQPRALGQIKSARSDHDNISNDSDTPDEIKQKTKNVKTKKKVSRSATMSGAIPKHTTRLPNEPAKREMRRNIKAQHVHDISVKSKKDKKKCYITGLVVLQGNKLVAADNNNKKVKVIDIPNHTAMHYIKLNKPPWDLATVTDDTVAVTMPGAATIQYLTVSTDGNISISKSLVVNGACHGIACTRQRLWVTFTDPGKVEALTLDGQVQLSVAQNVFTEPYYLALSPDMNTIYVSDSFAHAVIRISQRGKVLSDSQQDDISRPTGIAVAAENGQVYMCDVFRGVYMLSPRFEEVTKLLDKDQLGGVPWGLACSETSKLLYVGFKKYKKIRVYELAEYKL